MKKRFVLFIPAFLLFCTLSVYLLTACPTVYVGDTGELAAAAYSLGIPHPPGYPLFCLAGKAMTMIPVGNIAFRVNLLSVTLASFSVLVFFFLSRVAFGVKDNTDAILLLFSCFAAAFSRSFWNQAGMAKGAIYTMTTFFLLSSAYYCARFRASGRPIFMVLAFFLAGLSIVSHQTAMIFLPAIVIFFVFTGLSRPKLSHVLLSLFSFALAFCVFLYLILRAGSYPAVNCGNPSTLSGMFQHIFRTQYGGLAKSPFTFTLLKEEMLACARLFIGQFAFWAILLPLPGIALYFRAQRGLCLLSAAVILGLLFGLMFGTVFDVTAAMLETVAVFLIPAFLFFWLWAFPGALIFLRPGSKYLSGAAVILLASAALYSFSVNFGYNDKSNNLMAEFYGKDTLRSVPRGGVLFLSEDSPMYQLLYYKTVDGVRPDVTVVDETGTAFRTLLTEADRGVVYKGEVLARAGEYFKAAEKSGMPVCFTVESSLMSLPVTNRRPCGLLYLAGTGKNLKPPRFTWEGKVIPVPKRGSDVFNRDMYARYHFMRAEYLFETGDKEGFLAEMDKAAFLSKDMDWVRSEMAGIYAARGYPDESLKEHENAVKLFRYAPERRNNLANAYLEAGRITDGIRELEYACRLDPSLSAARHNLGNAYLAAKRFDEAREAYVKAAKLGQAESLDALNNMALQLAKDGKKQEALNLFELILSINKNFVFAWLNAGNIYFADGNYDEAARFYSNAVVARPDYAEGYFNLGIAYYHKGDTAGAKQMWKRVLELNPAHAGAANALKQLK